MPEKLTFEFDLSMQVKQAFLWHLPYVNKIRSSGISLASAVLLVCAIRGVDGSGG